jgi:O-antigen/teichoic acid export membrane protein
MTFFNNFARYLKANDFVKNIAILLSGTVIAQALPVAISPLLTRIYSPNDFGLLGIYIAICSLLAVFAAGRYDFAIIEPKHDYDAELLLIGSTGLSAVFSSFLFVIFICFNNPIALLLGNKDIAPWLYTVPISVFTVSTLSIFSYWLNRKKDYKQMSVNRVVNSSSNVFLTLGLGALKLKKSGLIIGYILGQLISVVVLWRKIFKEKILFEKKEIAVVFKHYKRYPQYLIASTFLSEVSSQVPLILLTSLFSASITGYYSLANRAIALPILLIGNALGEVYRQKAAENYSKFGNCKFLYLKALTTLFGIGLIPLIVLYFFSVPLFSFVFGEQWIISGEIAKLTSFLVFFQLLSTPLAYTITLDQSQKYDLLLQIGRAIFSISAIIVGYYYSSYYKAILFYTLVYVIYYISHSILQYTSACGNLKKRKR